MTASDILTQALHELGGGSSSRWATSTLLTYLSDGQYEVMTLRPDTRLNTDGTLDDYQAVTASDDTLILGAGYRQALVDYVVYRALSEIGADEENLARATARHQSFRARLGR